jgi:hypothetical protein
MTDENDEPAILLRAFVIDDSHFAILRSWKSLRIEAENFLGLSGVVKKFRYRPRQLMLTIDRPFF